MDDTSLTSALDTDTAVTLKPFRRIEVLGGIHADGASGGLSKSWRWLRRWGDEERLPLLAEALARGARGADGCRRHDVSTGLVYTWRRKLVDGGAAQEAHVLKVLPTPVFAERSRGGGQLAVGSV